MPHFCGVSLIHEIVGCPSFPGIFFPQAIVKLSNFPAFKDWLQFMRLENATSQFTKQKHLGASKNWDIERPI